MPALTDSSNFVLIKIGVLGLDLIEFFLQTKCVFTIFATILEPSVLSGRFNLLFSEVHSIPSVQFAV